MRTVGVCATGKRRFASEVAARLALAETRNSRSGRRDETRHYSCAVCRGWHLTSKAAR